MFKWVMSCMALVLVQSCAHRTDSQVDPSTVAPLFVEVAPDDADFL